jgi:hypothetical protein
MVLTTKKSSLEGYSNLEETEGCSKSYTDSSGELFGGGGDELASI